MKGRYFLFLATTVLLAQIGNTIALAQFNSGNSAPTFRMAQNPSNDTPPPPWAQDLNLSLEQRTRLKAINEQARTNGEALHQKLRNADEKLRSLLQNETTSIEAIRQQYQEVQSLRQQLDSNRFETLLAERQVLTTEQLQAVIEKFKKGPGPR